MDITWSETWATVIIGLGVVFAVLLVLVFLCWVLSKVMGGVVKSDKPQADKKEAPKAKKTPAPQVQKTAPVVEDGISNEVVAAISAAVACMMGAGKPFAIRSVKRARGARPVWSAAGIAENTRPF